MLLLLLSPLFPVAHCIYCARRPFCRVSSHKHTGTNSKPLTVSIQYISQSWNRNAMREPKPMATSRNQTNLQKCIQLTNHSGQKIHRKMRWKKNCYKYASQWFGDLRPFSYCMGPPCTSNMRQRVRQRFDVSCPTIYIVYIYILNEYMARRNMVWEIERDIE